MGLAIWAGHSLLQRKIIFFVGISANCFDRLSEVVVNNLSKLTVAVTSEFESSLAVEALSVAATFDPVVFV